MEMTISLNDLLKLIAVFSTVAITFALVPLLLQLRQTGRQAENLLKNVDREIAPLLASLKVTASELQSLSENIHGKITESEEIINTARHAGESLLITSSLIKTALTPLITNVGGIGSGLRAFLNFFYRTSPEKEKEGKSNE